MMNYFFMIIMIINIMVDAKYDIIIERIIVAFIDIIGIINVPIIEMVLEIGSLFEGYNYCCACRR